MAVHHIDVIVHVETDDEDVVKDLIDALDKIVPYMADNVVITSEEHNDG